ncbi:MAG: hypothetical protein H7Y20_02795, partial [Bryobacteraceae bacterium]|nr:hypothetical protein [Bryobacteraceae bacterium]
MSQADYDLPERELTQDWRPASTTEFCLVKEIAQSYWKLQRVRRVESTLPEAATTIQHRKSNENAEKASPLDETNADAFLMQGLESSAVGFLVLSRYETKYKRAWYRAINTLTKLQATRRKLETEIGFVPENDPDPTTLENAPPEIQKLILETAAHLVNQFVQENGFVPQNAQYPPRQTGS